MNNTHWVRQLPGPDPYMLQLIMTKRHYEEDMANYKKIIVWTRWGLVAALVTLGILMVMR